MKLLDTEMNKADFPTEMINPTQEKTAEAIRLFTFFHQPHNIQYLWLYGEE